MNSTISGPSKTLPYGRQSIDADDLAVVMEALQGDLITTGPWVQRFEEALADRTGAAHAVAVNSGTAALHCAYFAAGVGPGTKVITSPLTFAATANAARYLGTEVVFADVDPRSGCLDTQAVAALMDDSVRVVTCVDYAGHPGDYAAFRALQATHGFTLIADACHALGATYHDQPVGSLVDLSCFSFHPVKPVTTGEGGAVTTNDPAFAAKMRQFRTHGIARDPEDIALHGPWFYAMLDLGFNYRLTDIQAALGWSQLRKLANFTARRREIAAKYDDAFGSYPEFTIPANSPAIEPAYHLYPLRVTDPAMRRPLVEALHSAGIGVQVHYIPVYWHPYYESLGYRKGLCPQAEAFYAAEISLPVFPAMTDADVERVIGKVCAFMG